MQVDLSALGKFMVYEKEKYIAPAKAGARAEEMEEFKLAGQLARQAFQNLSKELVAKTENFQADKVSAWMNQAQIGRPHFWCYFFLEGDTRLDPTFAIRLKTIDGVLGISCELSFIERGSLPETLVRQNRVLSVPASDDTLYYWVQANGESDYYPLSEASRQLLLERLSQNKFRKILIKYDLPNLAKVASTEELIMQLLTGFEKLLPFYEATRA